MSFAARMAVVAVASALGAGVHAGVEALAAWREAASRPPTEAPATRWAREVAAHAASPTDPSSAGTLRALVVAAAATLAPGATIGAVDCHAASCLVDLAWRDADAARREGGALASHVLDRPCAQAVYAPTARAARWLVTCTR